MEEVEEDFLPPEEELEDIKLPNDISDFDSLFNSNPKAAISKLCSYNDKFSDPYYLGKLLCITKGLNPNKITEILTNSKFQPQPFFFFFFSALNIEFTPIVDAASVLFSRISFPNSEITLRTIFQAFSDAYLSKNPNSSLTHVNLLAVVISIVSFSARASAKNLLSPEEFEIFFKRTSLNKDNIFQLYNKLTHKTLQLNFSFAEFKTPPNLKLEGPIKRSKSVFSLRRSLFLKIDGKWLLLSNDPKFSSLKLKILLFDIFANVQKSSKDDSFELQIVSNKGTNLNIQPPKANEGKDPKHYYIHGDSKEELEEWAAIMNYVSFLIVLTSITNPHIENTNWAPDF